MNSVERTARVFFSGCLVYVFMAACSGSESSSPLGGSGHASVATSGGSGMGGMATTGAGMGGMGSGGALMSSSLGTGGDSGIMDALMDPVSDANADESGTRLKGKYLLGADGSKTYQHTTIPLPDGTTDVQPVWHDSMRNEDCSFRIAADGNERCLPGRESYQVGTLQYTLYYTDPQCTQPIVLTSAPNAVGCPAYAPPKYAYSAVQPALPSPCYQPTLGTRVFAVGASIFPVPVTVYYLSAGNACQALGTNNGGAFKATEVDPTSFVEGTAAIDP